MGTEVLSPLPEVDKLYLPLAQAIAMDLYDIEEILRHHNVTQDQWREIQASPRFQRLLGQAIEDWNKPLNTKERVRIKAQTMVEMGLETMWVQLHNDKEPLSARVELFKTVAKFGEIGLEKTAGEAGGPERFSVTINLGQDAQLKIEKSLTPVINLDAYAANEELIAGITSEVIEAPALVPTRETRFDMTFVDAPPLGGALNPRDGHTHGESAVETDLDRKPPVDAEDH